MRTRHCLAIPILLLICAVVVAFDAAGVVVVFNDSYLEEAVRTAIDKPLGEIQDTDLVGSGFVSLTAEQKFIADLTGLDYCTDLTTLHLANNDIVDLSPLASLTNLTDLDLTHNDIVDVSALSGLTQLSILNLDHNSIVDISDLSTCTALTELTLMSNSISDISALSSLTALEALNLNTNSIVNISPVASLSNLIGFSIAGNTVASFAPLQGLTHLQYLTATTSGVSADDLAVIATLSHLIYLDVANNSLTSIAPLASLTSLTDLSIWLNQISDLTPLSGLTHLESLTAFRNQLTTLSPLQGLTSLKTIYAANNQITSLAPLAGLTNLETLSLGVNQISDISVLANLSKLSTVSLASNQISDISALADLPNLSALSFTNNSIADLEPLVSNSGVGAGDTLNVNNNPLDQEAACGQITELKWKGVTVTSNTECSSDVQCPMFETFEYQGDIVAEAWDAQFIVDYCEWDIEGVTATWEEPYGDGIPDMWQLALFADNYCNTDRLYHAETVAAFNANRIAISNDRPLQDNIWNWVAATAALSDSMRGAICLMYGLNPADYDVVTTSGKTLTEPFSAAGDCDGDGRSNLEEYLNVVDGDGDVDIYVMAASENNPFWPGNPELPSATSIGLGAMCLILIGLGLRAARRLHLSRS